MTDNELLTELVLEVRLLRAALGSTSRSSVELAESAKGTVQLTVKSYQDSPIVDAGVNAIAEFSVLKREIERQMRDQWQGTVDGLAAAAAAD